MSLVGDMNKAIYTGRAADKVCAECFAPEGVLHADNCWLGDQLDTDNVNSPPHYKQGGIECIDAIEAALTAEEFRGYCKGNALKYVWREKHKGQNESLRKAIWYLNRALGE